MLRLRSSGTLPELHYITAARRRDGTVVEAEIHGSAAEVDRHHVLIGAAVEISRDSNPSRTLSDREQYFRALTEGLSDVVAIVNPLGRITYMSPSVEQHLGGSWTAWIDRLLVTSIHPNDRARFSRALDDLLTARSFGPEQFCLKHEDGSTREMEIAATNLLTHPQVQGFAFNLRDVTERNKMQQNQRLASLGQVAAQVAHEFNNALLGIDVNFKLLREMLADHPGARHAIRGIDSSLARSRQLTADILEFGRPPRLDLRPVQPDELVQRILNEVRPQLPASVAVDVELTEPPTILADPDRLAQVLVNLVLNARDAMRRAGGTLTIATSADSRFVHFKVTDTGEAIAPEYSQSIFQPLFTTKKKGSGLGLSVVHQIVTAHGGQISFDSEVGKGTTFDVCIPQG
jgi:PAS domain S-box-containing protein